jgi:hypothetical protein
MVSKSPDPGTGPRTSGPQLPPARPPHPFLAATSEELDRQNVLLREHVRTLALAHDSFRGYLDGRVSVQEWEEARRAADHARIAYERKRDVILVRTFRI